LRAAPGNPGKDEAGRSIVLATTPARAEHPGDVEMALLRRALIAIGLAGLVAAVLRLRGTGGTPPQQGGWRELSGPELQ
jgi:hypothetical protein